MSASKTEQGRRGEATWSPCSEPPERPMWCDGRWIGTTFSFPVFWNGEKWDSKVFGRPGDTWSERSSPPPTRKNRQASKINLVPA